MKYHSALAEELEIEKELDFHSANGSTAFKWDLTQGMHESYKEADAIYCEPSWRAGYKRFIDRASGVDTQYESYLSALGIVITTLNVPSFVVMGRHMVTKLKPEAVSPILLYGKYQALIGTWNTTPLENATSNEQVMEYVGQRYDHIADPSCGYGALCKYARHFTCSDINGKCIYYIAKTYMGYQDG